MDIQAFLKQFMPLPNSNWGTREDGTAKGSGWLGPVRMPMGHGQDVASYMTELSAREEIDGAERDFPLLVPTLTPQELFYLRMGNNPTDNIYAKAIEFARNQLRTGKSTFQGEE